MAFELNTTVQLLFLKREDFTRRIREHLESCMQQSVAEAVKAAAAPEFPVETGMAKATWRAVSQSTIAGKSIGVNVSIRPTRRAEGPRRGFSSGKSIESGVATTQIFFAQQGFKFIFRVVPGALHYQRGYFADASPSLNRARNAFRETMRVCYRRNFPSLRASIRTQVA